ncbi:hypothetical protein [Glaciimonas sp. PCH181]|uniref:hypothetical protein n=1 Tax=Glaciimonas sp. PCH181 TaxID=2133943 RepID=UPI000D3DC007|nr:hypothetical protein [Glaciimonas sp. PCH181]PUA17278.1 hypothetical protein C7W93_15210 [Glaciimonas sp. PCH181]
MTTIVSSTYEAGNAQADGRQYITEHHTADDGSVYDYSYLADNSTDINLVLTERATLLNVQLASLAVAQSIVFGTTLPLSVYGFLSRMTPQERIGIRAATKSDPIIEDFMVLLSHADVVYPLNSDVQNGLSYLSAKGLLTPDRVAVIGAA